VYCSITGYGLSGEWRNKACHDLNSLALTGVLDQMRDTSGVPIIPNLQFADLLGGGVNAAMGCLAALWGAQRSKKGCIVDVSMTDGILAHNLTAQVAVHHLGATKGPFEDLLNGGVPCYNLYRTQDNEWLALGALELKFWQQFCETLGQSAWANMHWSLGQGIGSKEAMELKAQVQSVLAEQTLKHWLDLFSLVDCCLTPVLTLKETMEHRLFQERGMFEVDSKGMRWLKSPVQFIDPS
jgi:crotonobetainyl-CoA:carnitine CoA-transferase CaiB-like acyl-CoA transferase